jgi:hypothetical protein
MKELIVGILKKIYNLRHIVFLAREEGLEPPTNGFGDHYSAN